MNVYFVILVIVSSILKVNNAQTELSSKTSSEEKREEIPPEYKYKYDFDFETAIVNGISPDLLRTANKTSASGFKSAPGCPEPYEGRAWVYYGSPPKCYLPGYQWPCAENMILLPQGSSNFGYCDCACQEYKGDGDTNLFSSPQLFCGHSGPEGGYRILAFQKEWGTCHFIFDQGKCKDGDWLIFSENPIQGPYCEKRRCPAEQILPGVYSFFDYRTNSCHKIGDRCVGPNYNLNRNPYITVKYKTNHKMWIPVCKIEENHSWGGSVGFTINESTCKKEEKFSKLLQMCVPLPVDRPSGVIG